MRRLSRHRFVVVLIGIVGIIGLAGLFVPAGAVAAIVVPQPPRIVPVSTPPDKPAVNRSFQVALQPADTGFAVVRFNWQITPDTSIENPGYFSGYAYPGVQVDVTLIPSWPANYFRANAEVTLSDGTVYTTPWSTWLPDWGQVTNPGPTGQLRLGRGEILISRAKVLLTSSLAISRVPTRLLISVIALARPSRL